MAKCPRKRLQEIVHFGLCFQRSPTAVYDSIVSGPLTAQRIMVSRRQKQREMREGDKERQERVKVTVCFQDMALVAYFQ